MDSGSTTGPRVGWYFVGLPTAHLTPHFVFLYDCWQYGLFVAMCDGCFRPLVAVNPLEWPRRTRCDHRLYRLAVRPGHHEYRGLYVLRDANVLL